MLLESRSFGPPAFFDVSCGVLLEARLFKKDAWKPVVPDVNSGGLFITLLLLLLAPGEGSFCGRVCVKEEDIRLDVIFCRC